MTSKISVIKEWAMARRRIQNEHTLIYLNRSEQIYEDHERKQAIRREESGHTGWRVSL